MSPILCYSSCFIFFVILILSDELSMPILIALLGVIVIIIRIIFRVVVFDRFCVLHMYQERI